MASALLTSMTNNLPPIIACTLVTVFVVVWLIIIRKQDRRSIRENVSPVAARWLKS